TRGMWMRNEDPDGQRLSYYLHWASALVLESVQLSESHSETSRLAWRSAQQSELPWPLRFGVSKRIALHLRTMDSSGKAATVQVPPNKALQTDKVKLSCLLHSQKPRQLAFAAELDC